MSVGALVLAPCAMALGALCAAADGALLSADADRSGPGGLSAAPAPMTPAQAALLRERERTHRALSFARLVAHLGAGAAWAVGLELARRPPAVATLLALLVAVGVVLLAETAPRAIGDAVGPSALRALRPVVAVVQATLRPITSTSLRIDAAFRRAFPAPARAQDDHETQTEQFRQVVEATVDVPRDTQAILQGVFSLGDTEVQEVMVPRVDVVAVERNDPWSEVLDRVRSAEHARLPVYEDDVDTVIGILYAKDLLAAALDDAEPEGGWAALVRPASFIPQGKTIDAQLRDFKATRTHIAIVVDEYGGTAGLITIEDILEEIVGEIRDEHDREELPIESEGGRCWWVSGRVSLDDLSEALGVHIEHEDVTTVGGLVFTLLGRVPRAGEKLTFNGFRIVVERVVRRRVERVYFERTEAMAEHPA